MRRLVLFLICILLLSAGCRQYSVPGVGKSAPENVVDPAEYDGGVPYSPLTFFRQPQVAIYKEIVYYECDPDDKEGYSPVIYSVPVSGTETPQPLFNGKMLGIYEGILLACDDEAYYAADLKAGSSWKRLQPAGVHQGTAAGEGKIFLFGYTADGNYADIIDLSSLSASRQLTEREIVAAEAVGDTLYYIKANSADYSLYRATFQEQQEEILAETPCYQLSYAGGKVICHGSQSGATVFDPETGASVFHPAANTEVINGILRLKNHGQNPRYLELATDQWVEDPGFEIDNATEIENGLMLRQENSDIRLLQLNGKEYTADLSGFAAGSNAANEHGGAFLGGASLCIADWSTGTVRQFFHRELIA